MERDEFVAGLKLQSIRPIDLVSFFRGLPRRLPAGSSEEHVEARKSVEDRLAVLNAHTLRRDADLRVPVDIEQITAQLANRLERFSSADWATESPSMLDAARQTLAEILADIRSATGEIAPDDAIDDPWAAEDE